MKDYLKSYVERFTAQKVAGIEPTKPTEPSFVGFVGYEIEGLTEFEPKNYPPPGISIEAVNFAKTPLIQPDKTDKTLPATPPEICPYCKANLKSDDTAEILVRFCPFGCSFVFRAFNDWNAARALLSQMLENITSDGFKIISDALDKQTTFYSRECGLDYQTAMQRAEAKLIPLWLAELQTAQKFKTPTNEGETR